MGEDWSIEVNDILFRQRNLLEFVLGISNEDDHVPTIGKCLQGSLDSPSIEVLHDEFSAKDFRKGVGVE